MFYDYQGIGTPVFIGLDNFGRILRDGQFWDSVGNTGVYALGKLVVTIPLSLTLAIILNRNGEGDPSLERSIIFPLFLALRSWRLYFLLFSTPITEY